MTGIVSFSGGTTYATEVVEALAAAGACLIDSASAAADAATTHHIRPRLR